MSIPREISKFGPKALAFSGWTFRGKILPRIVPEMARSQIERTRPLPVQRRVKILRRKGLLASPLCKELHRFANKHDRFRYRLELEERLPEGKLSRLYQFAFEGFRAFTASIYSAWDGYELAPDLIRQVLRQRINFLRNPRFCVEELKSELQSIRDYVMTDHDRDTRTQFSWFYPRALDDFNLLQASAALRALPPPLPSMVNTKEVISQLRERYTKDAYPPDPGFIQWMSEWAKFNQPLFPIGSFPIRPSTKACLEFGRKDGGLRTAIILLSEKYKLSHHEQAYFDAESKKIRAHSMIEGESKEFYTPSLQLICACVSCLRPLFNHARKCIGGCMKPHKHPPVYPLVIAERGYKTRVPTVTTAPLSIMARVLRSMADGFLRSDPRIRPSLEGKTILPKVRRAYWRSQDLTTATDNHNPVVTRAFYKAIKPYLSVQPPWYDDIVNVVCGYYTLIDYETMTEIRSYFEVPPPMPIEERFRDMLGSYAVKYADVQPIQVDILSKAHWWTLGKNITPIDYATGYAESMTRVYGTVTKNGQLMGVSTSWPLMPLMSIYAWENALQSKSTTISRKIVKRPKSYDLSAFARWIGKKGPYDTLKRDVRKGSFAIQTTGDDAIISCTIHESERHTANLISLGCVPSIRKDYLSPTYGIYTEVFYRETEPLGIFPWAPILSPSGVRQSTWYNQMQSIVDMEKRHSVKLPWNRSPYAPIWRHLHSIGIPIGLPRYAGGLGLPAQFRGNDFKRSFAALALMQRSLDDLVKVPGGFTIPDPAKDGLLLGRQSAPQIKPKDEPRKLFDGIKGLKHSLPGAIVATRSIPSPTFSITLREWANILRTQDTWVQIFSPIEEPDEPTLSQYIAKFKWRPTRLLTEEEIIDACLDAEADMNMEIDIPWGVLAQFHPVFGLITPCTPVPILNLDEDNRGHSRQVTTLDQEALDLRI